MKKKGLILTAVFFTLMAGCGNGTGNKISQGKEYLMQSDYVGAYNEFIEALEKNPESCDANYGILLSDTLMLIDQINAVISLTQGLGSTLSVSAGGIVDQIVQSFLNSFVEIFDEMDSAVTVIENKNCSFKVDHIIIQIGLSDDPLALFALKGQWDKPEAQAIGAIANFAKSLLKLILSIDLDLELDPILQVIQDPNSSIISSIQSCDLMDFANAITNCDIPGVIRELGFVMDITSTFLTWHPERANLFPEVAQEVSEGLRRMGESLSGIFSDVFSKGDQDNVIYIIDVDGDGKFTSISKDELVINAYKVIPGSITEPSQVTDEKCLYIAGICAETVLSLGLSGIDAQFISDSASILQKWSDGFDVQSIEKSGNEPEPLHLVELLDLLPTFISSAIQGIIPDVIRIRPWKFFATSVTTSTNGPRDWLPFWADLDGDGDSEFVIEAEWAEDATSAIPVTAQSYTSAGDASHFTSSITWNSNPITFTIPQDCVSIKEGDAGGLVYTAYQDPSFNGLLQLNLDNLNQVDSAYAQCENNVCEAKILGDWYTPAANPAEDPCGIYALNKVSGVFMTKLLQIIDTLSGLASGGF